MTCREESTCEWEKPFTEYRNNAEKILKLRIDAGIPKEECHEQIQEIVQVLCPFLVKDGPSCRFQVKPLTGGLSNHLFLVSNSNFVANAGSATNTVLVRIHPDSDGDDKNNTELEGFSVVNRESEPKLAAWLASQQGDGDKTNEYMAPTVYGRFENGRVEEFYTNVRPLTWGEMKKYAPWVAQCMASFHSLDEPPSDVLPRPSSERGFTVYDTIRSWLAEATKSVDGKDEGAIKFLKELSQEWTWLESELSDTSRPRQQLSGGGESDDDFNVVSDALNFIRRVAVTHMDCQPLNILIDEDHDGTCDRTSENKLRLIDFEYAGWNPIAADIANTFCEYCEMSNLCADYDKEYPTLAQQESFFWHYLLRADPPRAKQFLMNAQHNQEEENNLNGIDEHGEGPPSDAEWNIFCTTLQHEVGRFSLLSHLGWTIWSVVKAKEEDGIDFDYMAYARHRMDGYAWAKERFIME